MIRSYFGEDATDAFHNFHRNMPRAYKLLEKLPKKPAQKKATKAGEVNVEEEFRAWKADLEKRGFFKPRPVEILYKIVEPCIMWGLACAAMAYLPGWFGISIALVLVSMQDAGQGCVQHGCRGRTSQGVLLCGEAMQGRGVAQSAVVQAPVKAGVPAAPDSCTD